MSAKISKKKYDEMKALDGTRASLLCVKIGNVWYESESDWNEFRGTYPYPDMEWRPTHRVEWEWKFVGHKYTFEKPYKYYGELYRRDVAENVLSADI